MSLHLRTTVLVFILAGCAAHDPHEATIDRLNKDVGRLTREKATLEVRLEASDRAQRAMLSEIASLRQQLHDLAMRRSTAILPSPSDQPLPHEPRPVGLAGVTRAGGFTDWGQSSAVRAAPPEARSYAGVSPQPESRRSQSTTTTPSWNEVAKASDFYDANDKIRQTCSAKWPGDQDMFVFCSNKQAEAVGVLKQGRPFGVDENRFNSARITCANRWPTDFDMRVYCEQKELGR